MKNDFNPIKYLKQAIKTFAERGKVYGDGPICHGRIMKALFPDGLVLKTEEDFIRFGLFSMQCAKINRYSKNLLKGGHQDSIHDLGIYAFMLEAYDENQKGETK